MTRSFAALILLLAVSPLTAADKSHPRSLDPELKIELFAEHPTIVTPTGIDVDYKGRVFAVESNTHFPPSGYKGHPSDRVLVLEDTNGDGKADKTTVFTDGLTHTMSVKVKPLWLEARGQEPRKQEAGNRRQKKQRSKPNPQSAIRNPQSVYVATRRDIWLYHDDNGDLKADRRERIIKLETKGTYPHNGLAGIAFDAMGWMYFGFGENLGADYTIIGSDGTKLSGGGEGGNLYRCRPDGSKLTKWATGFWNPHASCVDAFGRLFTVDNDPDSRPPCRLLHIIEGGDYGFRFRNGRKGLHPFTAWNGEIPGTLPMVAGTGEAPSGIVAYESDGFPKKYIGNLFVGSWGDHRIDRFVLKPKGASFESRAETLIQGGEDFRPVGLAVAPDGSLFCTDWVKRDYKLHGHGRVWRISRKTKTPRAKASTTSSPTSRARQEAGTTQRAQSKQATARKPPLPDGRGSLPKGVIDLSTISPKRPVKELTALLSHARLDVRRMAANALYRSTNGSGLLMKVEKDQSATGRSRFEAHWRLESLPHWEALKLPRMSRRWSRQVGSSGSSRSAILKAEALGEIFKETLTSQELNQDLIGNRRLLADPFAFAAFVRSAAENAKPTARLLSRLLTSPDVKSGRTRVALLLTARRLYPQSTAIVKLGLNPANSDNATAPDVMRIAVQWAAEENLQQLKPQVAAVLNGKVMNADLFLATLAALEMLDGKSPKDFDKTPAGKYVLPIVKDPKRPAAVRAQALRLVDPDERSLNETLFAELLALDDAKLKTEAVRALQHSQKPFAAKLLARVAIDDKAPATLRADALAGLAGREIDDFRTVRTLIGMTASKNRQLRTEAIRAFRPRMMKTATGRPARVRLVRQIREALKNDPDVLKKDADLRGVAESLAAGYRQAGIRLPGALKHVAELRPTTTDGWYDVAKPQAGNVAAGRRIFFANNGATCFRCHTVNGRGGKIGPDLSTIARTANRRKLAQSILEPSKEIAPQYTMWSFLMSNGKVHHGMILGDTRNGKAQSIGTPEGKIIKLPLLEIEERRPQKKSLMPEKLIDRLTVTEFRDLLAFLESLK